MSTSEPNPYAGTKIVPVENLEIEFELPGTIGTTHEDVVVETTFRIRPLFPPSDRALPIPETFYMTLDTISAAIAEAVQAEYSEHVLQDSGSQTTASPRPFHEHLDKALDAAVYGFLTLHPVKKLWKKHPCLFWSSLDSMTFFNLKTHFGTEHTITFNGVTTRPRAFAAAVEKSLNPHDSPGNSSFDYVNTFTPSTQTSQIVFEGVVETENQ